MRTLRDFEERRNSRKLVCFLSGVLLGCGSTSLLLAQPGLNLRFRVPRFRGFCYGLALERCQPRFGLLLRPLGDAIAFGHRKRGGIVGAGLLDVALTLIDEATAVISGGIRRIEPDRHFVVGERTGKVTLLLED